jgi:hypothetical protein
MTLCVPFRPLCRSCGSSICRQANDQGFFGAPFVYEVKKWMDELDRNAFGLAKKPGGAADAHLYSAQMPH